MCFAFVINIKELL